VILRYRASVPNWRDRLDWILGSAITATDPAKAVAERLRTGPPLPEHDELMILAIGKAAAAMARGAIEALGADAHGLAVCPTSETLPGFEVLVGEHPVAGPGSFAAGHRLLESARRARPGSLVLVLLSGGASALAEVAAPGVGEEQIRLVTSSLLTSGHPIVEINRRRSELSALKAGGLTEAARPAQVVTFAISDVAPAGPENIGSGPSVGSDLFEVLADGATAAAAAASASAKLGLEPKRLADPISGPANEFGGHIGRLATGLPSQEALIGFGETAVRVDGSGRGGRNQEVALAAAIEIAGSSVLVGSIGTDGIDGPTDNAGAIVDGTTLDRGKAAGLDAETHLRDNDSASYLESVGDVIVTGPTGTNVGDLVVAVQP
jgi:glycerate-2-kinase